jgi:hypothetical protein
MDTNHGKLRIKEEVSSICVDSWPFVVNSKTSTNTRFAWQKHLKSWVGRKIRNGRRDQSAGRFFVLTD